MKKLIIILCTLLTITACGKPEKQDLAAIQKAEIAKTITSWCKNKSTLDEETRITVNLLLERAGTKDCKKAGEKLTNITKLYLSDNNISNLEPISDLTHLTELYLSKNNISNIVALSNLTNLTKLDLSENDITNQNLQPISDLTNLTELNLQQNQIYDIEPLSTLTNLVHLRLSENQISDIELLVSFNKLKTLTLESNQIKELKPLANLTNLEQLRLDNNKITDIKALITLTNLKIITLWGNPIKDLKPLSTFTTFLTEYKVPAQSFIWWCEQKATLPKQTRHTVEVLLEKEGITCNLTLLFSLALMIPSLKRHAFIIDNF
ncbi:MAG: leucine-rich repeat domain-containing protein, partial [Rivularia sp. ALOHA_DT_140]|nr:leucine-rich repeat domain-containing protein [Rivularia sp. ALOHA_DT_140]